MDKLQTSGRVIVLDPVKPESETAAKRKRDVSYSP